MAKKEERGLLGKIWDKVIDFVLDKSIGSLTSVLLAGGGVVALWSKIVGLAKFVWAQLIANVSVPIWLLGVLVLLALLNVGLWTAIKLLWRYFRHEAATAANKEHEIHFRGILWRYRIVRGAMCDAAPFCPRCDTQLHAEQYRFGHSMHETKFRCSHCRAEVVTLDGQFDDIVTELRLQLERQWRQEAAEKQKSPAG